MVIGVYLIGILLICGGGVFVVQEVMLEANYHQTFGGSWRTEFEKNIGSLSQAHWQLFWTVVALVVIVAGLVWFHGNNAAAKAAAKGSRHHSSSARKSRDPAGKSGSSRKSATTPGLRVPVSRPMETRPLEVRRPVTRSAEIRMTETRMPITRQSTILSSGSQSTDMPPLPPESPAADWKELAAYKKGSQIGAIFNVCDILGRGGFGIVYLVYDLELRKFCALKTFRDEMLVNAEARASFKREARHWVELGEYPYILAAHSVLEIDQRLFVRMDYVAADEEGRVTLGHHLRNISPRISNPATQLEWAVQFCLGMEYANKHGISCHRDIKPDNILITPDGVVKISDFGLAQTAEAGQGEGGDYGGRAADRKHLGLSLVKVGKKTICGTPGYIPPEVYRGEAADVRSDLYSFGCVLWQMAAKSPAPPFSKDGFRGDVKAYLKSIYETQMEGAVPELDSPLQPVIAKCLDWDRSNRYANFAEMREALEPILWRQSGTWIEAPKEMQKTAEGWYHRGVSMHSIGRYDDAMAAFDEALKLAPQQAKILVGKAALYLTLGRLEDSLACHDQIIALHPNEPDPWVVKGALLAKRARHREALKCFDEALYRDPKFALAWLNRGIALSKLRSIPEALTSLDSALAANPKLTLAWIEKGSLLFAQKKHGEALACFDEALALDPKLAYQWYNKGLAEDALGRPGAAVASFTKYMELAQANETDQVEYVRNRIQKLTQPANPVKSGR